MRSAASIPAPERLAEAAGLSWALGTALFTAVYFVLYLARVPAAATIALALIIAVTVMVVGLRRLGTVRATTARIRSVKSRRCGDERDISGGAGVSPVPGLTLGRASSAASATRSQADKSQPLGTETGTGATTSFKAVIVLCCGICVVQIAVALWVATNSLLRHDDAWTVWAWKARMFALGDLPPDYFTSHNWTAHPDYPLNLSLVESVFFRLPDPAGLTLASVVATVYLVALLLLFYAGLARLHGRAVAALAVGALALVPALPHFAGYGYADVPLATYGSAAALYLLLWWRQRCPTDLALMGLLAGGAIWTKKEGLPITLILLCAAAVSCVCWEGIRPLKRRLRPWLASVLATVALPLPWLVFTRIVRPQGSDFWPITPATFVGHADRLPTILGYFLQEAASLDDWSLLWIVAPVVVALALALRRLRLPTLVLLLMFLIQLGVYLVSYMFSYWTPYTLHIGSSLNRLVLQTVPLALLITVDTVCSLAHAEAPWAMSQTRGHGRLANHTDHGRSGT